MTDRASPLSPDEAAISSQPLTYYIDLLENEVAALRGARGLAFARRELFRARWIGKTCESPDDSPQRQSSASMPSGGEQPEARIEQSVTNVECVVAHPRRTTDRRHALAIQMLLLVIATCCAAGLPAKVSDAFAQLVFASADSGLHLYTQSAAASLHKNEADHRLLGPRAGKLVKGEVGGSTLQCRDQLSCWAEKHLPGAQASCRAEIEKLGIHRWLDGPAGELFARFDWREQGSAFIRYTGDRIGFLNGRGELENYAYSCDYDPATQQPIHVAVRPGKLMSNPR
jgi:hypothetical protein